MKEIHIKEGPFIKTKNKASNIMNNLLIALVPIILFAVYKNGYLLYKNDQTDVFGIFYPLIFILVSMFTSILTEYLYTIIIKKEKNVTLKNNIKTTFSLFPGLFLALISSINTPIWLLILGSFLATILGKLLWGGLGHNKINPALVGHILIVLIMSILIKDGSNYLNTLEQSKFQALPLTDATKIVGTYDNLVKPFGNLWDFFFGVIPGGVGNTSVFLTIIAFLYLVYKKALKWIIPLTYIGTVFIVTYFIGFLNGIGIWYSLFQILTGGLVFGAVFMATDPVTSPTTETAQVVYGMSLGILTIIFRFIVPTIEAVAISILIMNLVVGVLDKIGAQARFEFKKISILILAELIIILGLSLYIAENKKLTINVNHETQESKIS